MPRASRLAASLAASLAALLAVAIVVIHLVVNAVTPYGVHRDELLYLAMGTHLRFWRMDFPPLIAVLANLQRAIGGDSLVAIRFLPAVVSGVLTWAATYTARRFGGSTRSQLLAALAVIASPLFLRAGALFQPVIFDQLWWTLALLALLHIADLDHTGASPATRSSWLALGVVMGLGLLTKFSIAFIGIGIAAALLLTPMRASLRTPWPWLAVTLTFVIGSASLVGQWRLGFPVRGQMDDLRSSQLAYVGMGDFVVQQFLFGPQTLVAVAGAAWLLRANEARRWRVVGASAVAAFVLLMLLRGKAYYIGPIYPVLFGAGAVALERAASRTGRAAERWLLPAAATLVVAFGALLAPIGVPLVAPARLERYIHAAGLTASLRNNQRQLERLPQDFADMLPWRAQAESVAHAFGILSPAERARAVVIAVNYGEAGALDLYGPGLGLPHVVSPAGSFWFFGPGEQRGDVTVVLGGSREDIGRFFQSVERASTVREPFAVGEEQDVAVWIARHPRASLQDAWPSLKP